MGMECEEPLIFIHGLFFFLLLLLFVVCLPYEIITIIIYFQKLPFFPLSGLLSAIPLLFTWSFANLIISSVTNNSMKQVPFSINS